MSLAIGCGSLYVFGVPVNDLATLECRAGASLGCRVSGSTGIYLAADEQFDDGEGFRFCCPARGSAFARALGLNTYPTTERCVSYYCPKGTPVQRCVKD